MLLGEQITLSTEDYLNGEETAEVKHEYLNGEVWAMAGVTDNHVTIALNLAALLKQQLKNAPCRTYIADMKVRVEQANAFFYPDVLVTCHPEDRANPLYKEHPVFIAEVLSPSTEAFDPGNKFNAYRQLQSLQTYWLIDDQNQRIDSFTRTTNDDWLLHSYTQADEVVEIKNINVKCLLHELYEDVLPANEAG
jgi:Uma2 family endonuclease